MQYEFMNAHLADRNWVWNLFRDLLMPSIDAQWGWDESFQQESFDKHLPINEFKIIRNQLGGVGAFSLVKNVDHLHLKMLLVRKEFQSMGLGKQVIEYVKAIAMENSLPINLGVIKANPVIGFYAKLGFRVLGEENGSYELQWRSDT